MERLKGKVAVVTGAASGVGESIAKLFTSEGAAVVLIDRDEKNLKRVCGELQEKNSDILECLCDVSIVEQVKEAFDKTIGKYGKVDIVINNAGILDYNRGAARVTDEACAELIATNAMGELYCMREALKYMLPAKKGTFVAIGSVGGCLGHPQGGFQISLRLI